MYNMDSSPSHSNELEKIYNDLDFNIELLNLENFFIEIFLNVNIKSFNDKKRSKISQIDDIELDEKICLAEIACHDLENEINRQMAIEKPKLQSVINLNDELKETITDIDATIDSFSNFFESNFVNIEFGETKFEHFLKFYQKLIDKSVTESDKLYVKTEIVKQCLKKEKYSIRTQRTIMTQITPADYEQLLVREPVERNSLKMIENNIRNENVISSKLIRNIVNKKNDIQQQATEINKSMYELKNLNILSNKVIEQLNGLKFEYEKIQSELKNSKEQNLFACEPFPSVNEYMNIIKKSIEIESIYKIIERKIKLQQK